jgi:hypothetical protein
MTKKIKIVLGISVALPLVLALAIVFVFFYVRFELRQVFGTWPYDESHPAAILALIEDNSGVKFPEKIESLKAGDKINRGDHSSYHFILRFKTDQGGLAQLRESLSQLDSYREREIKPDQRANDDDFDLRISRKNKLTPEWYSEELPEGVVYTAWGEGVNWYKPVKERSKFHYIFCTCVTLAGSMVIELCGCGHYCQDSLS